jgi:hypothetical protein
MEVQPETAIDATAKAATVLLNTFISYPKIRFFNGIPHISTPAGAGYSAVHTIMAIPGKPTAGSQKAHPFRRACRPHMASLANALHFMPASVNQLWLPCNIAA